ncbi:MAG TPA: tRNA (adenosine(37)-N6)-threonylcarbamoyltransferase complex ATPase subunit type 1 TsaE [Acidimicrobiales bacterium]|nr:tRNA (adenosine(37)-N6)-threonylcarbamoyltransferase complex ATPase subunit type 1 TsaE [Acidimicrobiales bacterium]
MSWRRHCASAQDTREAGAEFAALLAAGDIVLLSGTLGAGKTTFVQGVAHGLGVSERVTSPTFQMVREHRCHNDQGIETLHHADVYRISSIDEVWDLALGELVEEAGVAVIEWGELAAPLFGRDVLTVEFAIDDDEGRTLAIDGALATGREHALGEWASR